MRVMVWLGEGLGRLLLGCELLDLDVGFMNRSGRVYASRSVIQRRRKRDRGGYCNLGHGAVISTEK